MAKDQNKNFSKEYIKTASKHMKRCSRSLVIMEIQIKTIMKYHLTLTSMVTEKHKLENNNKY